MTMSMWQIQRTIVLKNSMTQAHFLLNGKKIYGYDGGEFEEVLTSLLIWLTIFNADTFNHRIQKFG